MSGLPYEILGAVKVKDGLFIGDELAAKDLEFVVANKVTRVINCCGRQVPNHCIRPGGGPEVTEQLEYIEETLNPIMELLLKDILIVLPAEPLLFVVIWLRKRKRLTVDAEDCVRAGIAFDSTKCAGGQGKLTASQKPPNSSDDEEDAAALRAIYKLYIQYELNPLIEEITHHCVCEMAPDPTQFLLDFAERKLADMEYPGDLDDEGEKCQCVVS